MLSSLFVICALVGGTFLALQVAMTLIGLGGDALDLDVDADMDADVDLDVDMDMDVDGDVGDVAAHGSSWMFGIVSFRTVVAGLTFFGLGGMTAVSGEFSDNASLLIALVSGAAAMYVVFWMMQGLSKLKAEGTVRIHRSVGKHGTVYLRIPGEEAGTGKIHLNLQNRTAEYLAMTSGPELPTGAKVVVVDVLTSDTLSVMPIPEPERNENE